MKFIANQPYLFLSYCLLPDYPITMLNRNGGVQFIQGVFETEDKTLIAGLKAFIRTHSNECPIAEYKEGVAVKVEPKTEPIKPVMTQENKEMREKIVSLLRL